MFETSTVIMYSSLERTERFVRAKSILAGVRSSGYKFARMNWSKSRRVKRTDRMAQAKKSLEGVRSSEVEFAPANYFESRKVERRKREARATKVL